MIKTLNGKGINATGNASREKSNRDSWNNYFKNGIMDNDIRHTIASSWKRSQNYNLNPNNLLPPICSPKNLDKRLKTYKEILLLIRPFMDDLFDIVKGTDSLIAFSDQEGVILDLFGDSEIAINAAAVNFTLGANMNERFIGTTSIGLALKHGKAIKISGAEHYSTIWHTSHCSSSPLKDPSSNEIIGVITLVGYMSQEHPYSLGLVKTAADMMARVIEQNKIEKETSLQKHYIEAVVKSVSEGIIVFDQHDDVIHSNQKASTIMGISSRHQGKNLIKDSDYFMSLTSLLKGDYQTKKARLNDSVSVRIKKIIIDGNHIGSVVILSKEAVKNRRQPLAKHTFSSLISDDEEMSKAIKWAKKASVTDKNVLIIGESGTGKELFAQSIHNESNRKGGPFIAINSAAIPKELIASELFGYIDGAFTNAAKGGNKGKFEEANGGTIFLDEIGDMPLDMQVHLLRVLEQREITPVGSSLARPIDVRIIAATNKDLYELVQKNEFRLDLYYRLNVISIHVPPLRQRKQDIEKFVELMLPERTLSHSVLTKFQSYDWPGNIRELKNVLEQMEILSDQEIITEEYIPTSLKAQIQDVDVPVSGIYEAAAKDAKRNSIIESLRNSYHIKEAAEKLGVSPSTLYRWANQYDIRVKEHMKQQDR